MKRVRDCLAILSLLLLAAVTAAVPPLAQERVDLNLALTVDVSLSMDLDEQRLQREGYVAAFRDPQVLAAIRAGANRRIAVTYVEWAGEHIQTTVIPWTLIDGKEAADAFAASLESKPISRERMTSISGALLYASRTLAQSPYAATRSVVDVSGDGPNNAGPPVVMIRDELVARGIVINGLPLLLKTSGYFSSFDIPNLDEYYADCVIGGPGAFSLPVRDKAEFATAVRQKLVLEIANLTDPRSRLWRTQSESERPTDCMIGEKKFRRYMDR